MKTQRMLEQSQINRSDISTKGVINMKQSDLDSDKAEAMIDKGDTINTFNNTINLILLFVL